jgi:hypothetical protein
MYSTTPDGGPVAVGSLFKNQKGNFTLVVRPRKVKREQLTMIF